MIFFFNPVLGNAPIYHSHINKLNPKGSIIRTNKIEGTLRKKLSQYFPLLSVLSLTLCYQLLCCEGDFSPNSLCVRCPVTKTLLGITLVLETLAWFFCVERNRGRNFKLWVNTRSQSTFTTATSDHIFFRSVVNEN